MNVEELQMEVDIRQYDMKDAPMNKCQHNRHLLTLEVSHSPVLLKWVYTSKPQPCLTEVSVYK